MKYWVTVIDKDYNSMKSREIMDFINEDEAERYAKNESWTGEFVYVTKVKETK